MTILTSVYLYGGHWRNPLNPERQYKTREAAAMALVTRADELLKVANAELLAAQRNPDPDIFRYQRLDGSEYREGSFPIDPPRDPFVIDHPRYGEPTAFATLADAEIAIRDCGEDFEDTSLTLRGDDIIDDRGEVVGSFTHTGE